MGKKLTDYTDKQLATVIGVVLTEKCSLRNMTVEELVGMGRSPYTGFWGNLSKEDKNTVNDTIELVRIEDLKYRMVHTLSDGERQKVMIAKALAQETPVIFLDEPTAFLDFPSKVEIMQLLHHLSRSTNKTIFLSTHDLELALQIADKIWLMDKANGVTIGTPEDLSIDGCLSNFSPVRVLFLIWKPDCSALTMSLKKKSVWWDMEISMRWYGKLCSGMVFWQAGVLSPIFILKREI